MGFSASNHLKTGAAVRVYSKTGKSAISASVVEVVSMYGEEDIVRVRETRTGRIIEILVNYVKIVKTKGPY